MIPEDKAEIYKGCSVFLVSTNRGRPCQGWTQCVCYPLGRTLASTCEPELLCNLCNLHSELELLCKSVGEIGTDTQPAPATGTDLLTQFNSKCELKRRVIHSQIRLSKCTTFHTRSKSLLLDLPRDGNEHIINRSWGTLKQWGQIWLNHNRWS